ncbi:phage scaffolding protein [Robertmurraya siralis]|uniref:phage scaffolding protein n=1 Tax=Robertmurraya siralis TaxID=77777 RepID=UPI0010FA01B4|nr:phage scaffolding protein [Robertmurraya siralis]
MKREFLEGLGLEKDKIESIMTEHGKTVESYKTKNNDLNTSLDDLKKQLEQRDKDLKELKKQTEGSEELKTKLDTLQKQYDADKTEYETKLKDTQLSSAIKLALAGKVHDADLVTGLIDKAKIELGDDGNVSKGLDEQLKSLQESKSFLFVPDKKDTQKFKGFVPGGGNSDSENQSDIGADFAKMANERSQAAKNENDPWG